MIQAQLTPVFLAIPAQHCLKCIVINLRLDVSNCDGGLVVHALEAGMNHAFLGASKRLAVVLYPLGF